MQEVLHEASAAESVQTAGVPADVPASEPGAGSEAGAGSAPKGGAEQEEALQGSEIRPPPSAASGQSNDEQDELSASLDAPHLAYPFASLDVPHLARPFASLDAPHPTSPPAAAAALPSGEHGDCSSNSLWGVRMRREGRHGYDVCVPGGLRPGDNFVFNVGPSEQMEATLPEGVVAGMMIHVRVPILPASSPTTTRCHEAASAFGTSANPNASSVDDAPFDASSDGLPYLRPPPEVAGAGAST